MRKKPGNRPKGYPSKKAQKTPRNKSGYPNTINWKKVG